MKKVYLGDGLYAEHDGYQARLFTQQGMQVFMDSSVVHAFQKWLASLHETEEPDDTVGYDQGPA